MKYLAITAILCLILAGVSFAGNVTMTEVITGGGLTLEMPGNFSWNDITLGGFGQTNTGNSGQYYRVEDSRGSGAGWNLGFQIGQFTTSGTPQRSIGVDKFNIKIIQNYIAKTYGQSVDNTYGPKTLHETDYNLQNTEEKFVTATTGYGMGKYDLIPQCNLVIDANVYAGTYTATLTATLNNTP